MNVAIIPARAGSKRIPKKNIKKFQGKPIFYWPLIAAKKTNLFDKIILSTDSKSIAKIGKKYNMDVPFLRPKNISGDHASTSSVISHAIRWLRNNNVNPKFICCIYPTAAYLNPKDLITGYKKIKKNKWDYVFSGGKFNSSIFRSFKKNRFNGLKMLFSKYYKKRTQDIFDTYHDAGQFYWGRSESWLKEKPIFAKNSTIVEIPTWRIHDIDTIEDWKTAEKMWKLKNLK